MRDEINLVTNNNQEGNPNLSEQIQARDLRLIRQWDNERRQLIQNQITLLEGHERNHLIQRNLLNFVFSGTNFSNMDGLTNPNLESQNPSFLNKFTRLIVQHPKRSLLSLLSGTLSGFASGAILSLVSGKEQYSYTFSALTSGVALISFGFIVLAPSIQRYLNNSDGTLLQLRRFQEENQTPQILVQLGTVSTVPREDNQTPQILVQLGTVSTAPREDNQTPQILVQLGTVSTAPREENQAPQAPQTPQTPQISGQSGTVSTAPREDNQISTRIDPALMAEIRSTTPISLSSQQVEGQNFLVSILEQSFQTVSSFGTILFQSNQQQDPDQNSVFRMVFFNELLPNSRQRPQNQTSSPLAISAQEIGISRNNLV